MTKADFYDWKRHPVTQQVFSQLNERVEEIKEYLIHNAGKDSYDDARRSGAALALYELLNVDYEESHGS